MSLVTGFLIFRGIGKLPYFLTSSIARARASFDWRDFLAKER